MSALCVDTPARLLRRTIAARLFTSGRRLTLATTNKQGTAYPRPCREVPVINVLTGHIFSCGSSNQWAQVLNGTQIGIAEFDDSVSLFRNRGFGGNGIHLKHSRLQRFHNGTFALDCDDRWHRG